MSSPKYIDRCYHVDLNERKENAQFYSIFEGAGKPKWRFSNFPRFRRHVVKHGLDWISKTWTGLVKHGLVKHGLVKHGLVKHGLVKHGFVKGGFVKHGFVKGGFVKHGLTRCFSHG